MRRRWSWFNSPRARSSAGLGCIALLLVAANILAVRYLPQHLDLTAERLYTLSDGTRQTLAHIDEPITLRFYNSPRLGEAIPAYGVYAQRVRELLDQYVAAAHGKLRLEVFQPQPFSDEEDRAVALGLQGVPLNTQGEQVYFGLAGTNSTDDQQTIAFFAPERERLLEYDLTRVVHALAFPKRVVVGVISGLPLDGGGAQGQKAQPMALFEQLRQLYDVETLPASLDAIPTGTDVLMLAQPQKLPERSLYAIDQFVLQGGRAIVFADPYSELLAQTGHPAGGAADSGLALLFKAWGARLLPDTVSADRQAARRVMVPAPNGGGQPMDYIAWLDLRAGELNREDVITAGLRQVTMASAGIIEPLPGASTKFEPLVTTSADAMKLRVEQVAGLPDVAGLMARFRSDDTRYVLAAHITGEADSAFPDGTPQSAPAIEPLRHSLHPLNLVLVADSDMLDERFWARTQDFFGRRVVTPIAGNADFVANAIDVLAGGEDLVGLRSRGSSARPFEVVERIQRDADERYAAERQGLERKLEQTQAKLRELTHGEPAAANPSLTPEQARAVDQFRADLLTTRRQLRTVQAALRQDIAGLKLILEFCDIALVPIIVAAAAIVLGLLRLKRWRRRPPGAAAA